MPPCAVTGIEGVSGWGESVAVIDGDGSPALGKSKGAIVGCEAWPAGDDASDLPPPAPSGAVNGLSASRTEGFAGFTSPSPSNRSAVALSSRRRCLRVHEPSTESVKWLVTITSMKLVIKQKSPAISDGASRSLHQKEPEMNAAGRYTVSARRSSASKVAMFFLKLSPSS